MKDHTLQHNQHVSKFLDGLDHPLRKEIESLRELILTSHGALTENIKWNGPNYRMNDQDRITMKINPPKTIQLIFHRGAKVQAQPPDKLVSAAPGFLEWRGNDRAIATFKNAGEIDAGRTALTKLVNDWIGATT